jgi:hypothetical protein
MITLREYERICDSYLDEFINLTKNETYMPKGIYFSGLFAFCALCKHYNIDTIIDSGTGKYGFSCKIFAKLFPTAHIYTIDTHELYNNLDGIKSILYGHNNITFITGYSQDVIPNVMNTLTNKRVAIMYDGPKGKNAHLIQLALSKYNNILFTGYDDCGNNMYTRDSHNYMLKQQYLAFSDGDWFYDRYGFVDRHVAIYNDNTKSIHNIRIINQKYPKGPGVCIIQHQ